MDTVDTLKLATTTTRAAGVVINGDKDTGGNEHVRASDGMGRLTGDAFGE